MIVRSDHEQQTSIHELRLWKNRSLTYRRSVCRAVARKAADEDTSDPFTFDRVYSRLTSNVECPHDYSWSPEQERRIT